MPAGDPKYTELWEEVLSAETAVSGASEHSKEAVARLKQQIRPGGLGAGDAHTVATLRARIASVVAHIS